MRGSRDFIDQNEYEQFTGHVIRKANAARGPRVAEEIAAMRPLVVSRLPEYSEMLVPTAPSRLIGQTVRVRLFERRIEVYFADALQLACERLHGREVRIDYRHVIWSLVRKPGAFARYVYRDAMFPTITFRKAYDAIQTLKPGIKGDVEYLRILHLAASTSESDVDDALASQLAAGSAVTAEATKAKAMKIDAAAQTMPPELSMPAVDLTIYNSLLTEIAS